MDLKVGFHMGSLKKIFTNERLCKIEIDPQIYKTNLWLVTKGEVGRRIN